MAPELLLLLCAFAALPKALAQVPILQIGSGAGSALTVAAAGTALAALVDDTAVEQLWLEAQHVSFWSGRHHGGTGSTHCSAYAAAFADRLGVYLPSPPNWSRTFLANRQYVWLLSSTQGVAAGWKQAANAAVVQAAANAGYLALVSFNNTAVPEDSGHIAVVRPFAQLASTNLTYWGPRVAQAGSTNYLNATARTGFGSSRLLNTTGTFRYFFFNRTAAQLSPVPSSREWLKPASGTSSSATPPLRYLLDTTPEGRLIAVRLEFNASAATKYLPQWQWTRSHVPIATSGTTVALPSATWYRYLQKVDTPVASEEPFLKGTLPNQVVFTLGRTSSSVAVKEGSASQVTLTAAATQDLADGSTASRLTGLWHVAFDNATFGVFFSQLAAAGAQQQLKGYVLSFADAALSATSRQPRWWSFAANGTLSTSPTFAFSSSAVQYSSIAWVASPTPAREVATPLPGLYTLTVAGTRAAMSGLPGTGGGSLELLKATMA